MSFSPRVPLCAAERVVDFEALDHLILDARESVEEACWPAARGFADALELHDGVPSLRHWEQLRYVLATAGVRLARKGYDQVLDELEALRSSKGIRSPRLPDAGSVNRGVLHLATDCAQAYADYLVRFWSSMEGPDQGKLHKRARMLLHNAVMEMVGRVLNLGRTEAALGNPRPMLAATRPALWAMRSEQLDENTCFVCDDLHGARAIVGTDRYFELLPPNGCRGRGRCRGVMVYADDEEDLWVRSPAST